MRAPARATTSQDRHEHRLRKLLRTTIARFDLFESKPCREAGAIQEDAAGTRSGEHRALARAVGVETDAAVKEEIQTGLALAALDGNDPRARLEAVATLAHRLRPQVRKPARWRARKSCGRHVCRTRREGQAGRRRGRTRDRSLARALCRGRDVVLWSERWIGARLVATGLANHLRVMGVINMAHGELMMLARYTTYVVQLRRAEPHRQHRFCSPSLPRSSLPVSRG